MEQICLRAYAKINLTLEVLGRRGDGYHLLESIMQSVSLADLLILRRRPRGISLTTDLPCLERDKSNLCWQAAEAFFKETKIKSGIEIELKKRIPIAAGLGGGSSDAAAVLLGLNELYQTKLGLACLQRIGLSIGADVPFCLQGGTCFVQGIGEKITPLRPLSPVQIVLLKPEASVSTAEVFRGLQPKSYGGSSTRRFLTLLEAESSIDVLSGVFSNVLETVTLELLPQMGVWKERLLAAGALSALMSGSGPTVFGLFDEEKKAGQFCLNWKDSVQIYRAAPVQCGVKRMNGGD